MRVPTGQGAKIDTTTALGWLVFGNLAALAEFERELISERTIAGISAARAKGRKGGREFALTKAQVRLARAALRLRNFRELRIKPVTLDRYVGPDGELRKHGKQVLGA